MKLLWVVAFGLILLVGGPPAFADDESGSMLTGVSGIDHPQALSATVLDARGKGLWGSAAVVRGQSAPLQRWLLADSDATYEIALNSTVIPDGVVRLSGRLAFLIDNNRPLAGVQFRLFAGRADFFFPNLPGEPVSVVTPVGRLVTSGAAFTVAVTLDDQVVVTCRDGQVFLTGQQNAVCQPGMALVADRQGQSRHYEIPVDRADEFVGHWQIIAAAQAPQVFATLLPKRLAAWNARRPQQDPENTLFLALWFRQAEVLVRSGLPERATWATILEQPVTPTGWEPPLQVPGPLGEAP